MKYFDYGDEIKIMVTFQMTKESASEQRSWTSQWSLRQDIDFDGGYNGSLIMLIARNNVFCLPKEKSTKDIFVSKSYALLST